MKMFILIISIMLLFCCESCQPWYNINFSYPEVDAGVPKFDTIEDMSNWVLTEIKSETDMVLHGVKEYWQPPDETYELKAGDCEDRDMFFMYLLETQFRIDPELEILKFSDDGQFHTRVLYANGKIFDTLQGEKIHKLYVHVMTISYKRALYEAEYNR